jgi:3-hydroxybutyryl-CoA dehydrogenase
LEERLGIVGSGQIACGLAAVAAEAGNVVLWARSPVSARRATVTLERLTASENAEEMPDGLSVVTDADALGEATFIVEAIVEDARVKAEVLSRLGALARPDAVLATTTSSLPVESLAAASGHPERFVGFHVFNPVSKMDLVELAFPAEAGDETRRRARALCEALGKTAVEVPGLPGFVVNRLLFPYLFAAVRLLEETGMPPEDLDACMKLGAGHPMGPLALLDLVGLDVAQSIGEAIGAELPERVSALVAEGAVGRKAGRGFYSYEEE